MENTNDDSKKSSILSMALGGLIFFCSFTYFLWAKDPTENSLTKRVLLTKRYWKAETRGKPSMQIHWLELAFSDFQQNMIIEKDCYRNLNIADFKNEVGDYDTVKIKYQGDLIYALSKNGKEYIKPIDFAQDKKSSFLFWSCISLGLILWGFIKHHFHS